MFTEVTNKPFKTNLYKIDFQITSIPKGVLDLNEGCVDVVLTQDDISKLANKTSDLKAHISVEEAVTGDIQNQSWSGSVVFLPFKLDFEESSNQYIVGKFPYVGILKAVDHSGKPKENVKVIFNIIIVGNFSFPDCNLFIFKIDRIVCQTFWRS